MVLEEESEIRGHQVQILALPLASSSGNPGQILDLVCPAASLEQVKRRQEVGVKIQRGRPRHAWPELATLLSRTQLVLSAILTGHTPSTLMEEESGRGSHKPPEGCGRGGCCGGRDCF